MPVIAWINVLFFGLLRLPVKLLAPIAVLFVDRKNHPVWGVNDTDDLSWWNVAIRNGAHNFTERPTVKFDTWTNTPDDETLEQKAGFQWRYRRSASGAYVSFRCTWGEPRPEKGKREFYIGWTMNDQPVMRCTFFQFRPF